MCLHLVKVPALCIYVLNAHLKHLNLTKVYFFASVVSYNIENRNSTTWNFCHEGEEVFKHRMLVPSTSKGEKGKVAAAKKWHGSVACLLWL